MTTALMIGTACGALLGSIHAGAVFARHRRRARGRRQGVPYVVNATAAYFAAWTFMLWIIFGSYVLVLWIVTGVIYAGYLLWRPLRPTSSS